MQVGYAIRRIILRMNMMIGAIEVWTPEEKRKDSTNLKSWVLGYALALGNFNHDDNQGMS